MKKSWPIAAATVALILMVFVGFMSFGRGPAPSASAIPAGPGAVETPDGAETAPLSQP